jgi:hypothetical protein
VIVKILLVNRFNVTEKLELSEAEADSLLDTSMAKLCIADSLAEEAIALHPTILRRDAFAEYVQAFKLVREQATSEAPDDLELPINPFTGRPDGIFRIVAKPKDKE